MNGPVALRYMGTKRELVPHVHECVGMLPQVPRRFVDLFAGGGSVAASLANDMHVTCSDALHFPSLLARSRFLRRSERLNEADIVELEEYARTHARPRIAARSKAIAEEGQALDAGHEATSGVIENARHVGNDSNVRLAAHRAAASGAHSLTTQYFARGYFSTAQAVHLDSYRHAIDLLYPTRVADNDPWRCATARDVLLSAWVVTASRIINSPGHTAQFLHSSNERSHLRVAAAWRRRVDAEFRRSLVVVHPLGGSEWRRGNTVMRRDATGLPDEVLGTWKGAVLYADPPYTKDHYSRYYHVLETLLLYDYPTSRGAGRVRDDRHLSGFCYRSKVAAAFAALGRSAAQADCPLIISYPSAGLLPADELRSVLEPFGRLRLAKEASHRHSTMGGSPGRANTDVMERIYILQP